MHRDGASASCVKSEPFVNAPRTLSFDDFALGDSDCIHFRSTIEWRLKSSFVCRVLSTFSACFAFVHCFFFFFFFFFFVPGVAEQGFVEVDNMVSLAEMASVLAFIVTVALLLADAHQSSSQLSASAAELRSLHELNANLQSDFDERITDARRDLKLSDATCRTACLNSKRIAGKAHLRDKVKMQTCFGQERTSTCCLCLQDGYSLEDADAVPETESSDAGSDVVKRLEDQLAVAQQAIAENYERAAFDKVALDDAKEKLYAAQQEMTKLKEQASSGSVRTAVDVEVDDLDPATYKIDCHPPVPKQVSTTLCRTSFG